MKRKTVILTAAALAAVSACTYAAGPGSAATGTRTRPVVPTATASPYKFSPATMVAQLAGVNEPAPRHPNNTAAQDMRAADLGVMWDNGAGTVNVAFGDNYGSGWNAPVTVGPVDAPPSYTADYRPNALAKSTDGNLADGMTLNYVVNTGGVRKAMLNKQGNEVAVIPTAGVHVGSTDYLFYMAVNSWGTDAGAWTTNGQGIATSTDGGNTWSRSSTVWSNSGGDANFQQAAAENYAGYVYVYGTPNGRFGSAYLSKVPEGSLLTKSAYRYWNGSAWVTGSANATPITDVGVGEMSVFYDSQLSTWIMTYLNQNAGAIVARTAPAAEGPWSTEQTIVANASWTTYGAFIHPWSNGTDLYFVESQWGTYQTYLMHTTIGVTCGG